MTTLNDILKVKNYTHYIIHYWKYVLYRLHKLKQFFIKKNSLIYLCNTIHNERCYVRPSIRMYLVRKDIKTTLRKGTLSGWRRRARWWCCWSIYPTALRNVKHLRIKRSADWTNYQLRHKIIFFKSKIN